MSAKNAALALIPMPLLLPAHPALRVTILVLHHHNVLVAVLASMLRKELPSAKNAVPGQFPMPLLLPAHLVQKACTRILAPPHVLDVLVTTAVINDGGRATVPMLLIPFRVSLSMTMFCRLFDCCAFVIQLPTRSKLARKLLIVAIRFVRLQPLSFLPLNRLCSHPFNRFYIHLDSRR